MMKRAIVIVLSILCFDTWAQVTVTPAFPNADQEITITYDATKGTSGLVGATKVFMHSGTVVGGPTATTWSNVKGTWGDPASIGEMTSLGNNQWQIKITPRTYFGVAAGVRIYRIGMVFRSAGPCGGFSGASTACREGKTSANGDIFTDLFEGNQFQLSVTEPSVFPVFKNDGDNLLISATTSASANITIKVNGDQVASEQGVTTISHTHVVVAQPRLSTIEIVASDGTDTKTQTFNFIVRSTTVVESRPAGIVDGINYQSDLTKVTLSLWAPGKSNVYVIGDFTNWKIDPAYQMKRSTNGSSEHFWLELGGLTGGQEYAFQYLIDESIYVADPYSDKILDPDDSGIPASAYPALKSFPAAARQLQWYFNRLSVLQTGQQPYAWKSTNFQKPTAGKLVIYELLIRDFFEANSRTYKNVKDTLSYLKRLGVNAIELMPIMEFNGNDSWGYNPAFMFAPDKYYGPKNELKALIDACHQAGIAVILDIAMNHQDVPNPYVMMDFDFTSFKPTPANKWFNVTATHPFSVFYDMNHESSYTKTYLDTVNYYWLNEYKVDGYRFDLSKGFTQKNNPSDVGAWSAYDASRIAILERMADKIWSHVPDAYVILEHLSDNSEEKELAEYRSAEGKGMLLWAKMTDQYNQSTMGYSENSDISSVSHVNRGWTVPHAVGYMESHDEERLMYKNIQFGKVSGNYSTKDIQTALRRLWAASAMFYTIPGPKMLWQFGELGYDQSINLCADGTNNSGCRVNAKPVKWNYKTEPARDELFNYTSDLIRLRKEYSVFTNGDALFAGGTGLVKQVAIRNKPYVENPSGTAQMNAHVIANFDLVEANATVGFLHYGAWYNYYTGEQLQVSGNTLTVKLQPGQVMLFTDVPIKNMVVTAVEDTKEEITIYPSPFSSEISVTGLSASGAMFSIYSLTGQQLNTGTVSQTSEPSTQQIAPGILPAGVYILRITDGLLTTRFKIIKE